MLLRRWRASGQAMELIFSLLPTPYRLHAYPQFTGRGVVMAFLDSGFYPHPDLTLPHNRILAHIDATARTPVERPNFKQLAPTSWHGLMTSAVAAGSGFLSGGAWRGIACDAQLVLVKTGNRRGRRIYENDIARALEWVILNQHRYNIRVVNLSVGGDHPSPGEMTALDKLVEKAVARGLVVVCAVGNGNVEHVIPPASAPSAITVGGVDDQNSVERHRHRLYPSHFGRGADGRPKPELLAPARWLAAPMLPHTRVHNEAQFLWKLARASDGELRRVLRSKSVQHRFTRELGCLAGAPILDLPADEIRRVIRKRMVEQKYIHPHYQHVEGTSMAAPIVSAVVAQMLEANPWLTPAQVKDILISTADPLPDVPREQQGFGVVNASRAVAHALRAWGGPLHGLPLSPHLNGAHVSFLYYAPQARCVTLVGEWDDWTPKAQIVQRLAPDVWQFTIPRPPAGVYAYKFRVERDNHQGQCIEWVGDPENEEWIEDGGGGVFSLLVVSR